MPSFFFGAGAGFVVVTRAAGISSGSSTAVNVYYFFIMAGACDVTGFDTGYAAGATGLTGALATGFLKSGTSGY